MRAKTRAPAGSLLTVSSRTCFSRNSGSHKSSDPRYANRSPAVFDNPSFSVADRPRFSRAISSASNGASEAALFSITSTDASLATHRQLPAVSLFDMSGENRTQRAPMNRAWPNDGTTTDISDIEASLRVRVSTSKSAEFCRCAYYIIWIR